MSTDDLVRYARTREHDEDPIVTMAREMGDERLMPEAGMVYAGRGHFEKQNDGSMKFEWNDDVKAKMERGYPAWDPDGWLMFWFFVAFILGAMSVCIVAEVL